MRTALLAVLLLFSMPVMADAAKGTVVSLAASAAQILPNDEVVVSFRIEAEGRKAAALGARVNRISQAVSKRLAREKGVHLATTGRSLEPRWHLDNASHRQVRDGWRMVQNGRATSRDLDAVAAWVDAIELAGAHLDGLRFRISASALQAAENRLRMRAIARFRAQAAATAKALDATSFRILRISTDHSAPGPMPMMAMARGAAPVPALAAGQGRVTVGVSGTILLPERDYPVQ
jgi:predicted secreted protein